MVSRLQRDFKKRADRRSVKTGKSRPAPTWDGWHRISRLLEELREYAAHYFSARKDLARAKARQMAAKAGLMSLIFLTAAAAILVSVWLLLTGIALGLGVLFGDRIWLGYVVTGLLFLGIMGFAGWYGLYSWRKSSRERTIRQYEHKHEDQEARFHRSVAQPCPDTHQDEGNDRVDSHQDIGAGLG